MCRLKKIATILLLGILLFNWFGYQILTSYLEQRANQRIDNLVDRNIYQESQLISIKVPADHLGYFINSSQFERVMGKIVIAGIQYNFVKKRLYNDSLELFCIPNTQATALKSVRNEICKWLNDQSGQNKKSDSNPGAAKNFSTDYYVTIHTIDITDLDSFLLHESRDQSQGLSFPHLIKVDQPPEILA
ncbi:MAG TPA: hypothetical protein VFV08_08815 [Puia sp.]|nr:hypothetical protein [Puia sp.]